MTHIVLQIDPSQRPSGTAGVLKPTNADGFYSDLDDAEEVAEMMKRDRPHLKTFVATIAREIP